MPASASARARCGGAGDGAQRKTGIGSSVAPQQRNAARSSPGCRHYASADRFSIRFSIRAAYQPRTVRGRPEPRRTSPGSVRAVVEVIHTEEKEMNREQPRQPRPAAAGGRRRRRTGQPGRRSRPGIEPSRGARHHGHAEGRRHRFLHVQQLRAGPPDRPGFVTLLANYLPLQDAYGGPNYFALDPNALYEIHVDNNGDGKEDLTFQFRFTNKLQLDDADVGGKPGPIPLKSRPDHGAERRLARTSTSPTRSTRARRSPHRPAQPDDECDRPVPTSSPSRSTTSARRLSLTTRPTLRSTSTRQHSRLPAPAKVFVGQRKDPFAVNLGGIFDLLNVPGAADFTPAEAAFLLDNSKKDAGQTTSPTRTSRRWRSRCLRAAWAGGERPRDRRLDEREPAPGLALSRAPRSATDHALTGGAWTQVSRLCMPLVNEVVIGLPDKDRFNGSKPKMTASSPPT